MEDDKIIKNIKLLYDKCGFGYSSMSNYLLLGLLKEYNKSLTEPYLVTGQSCYYNQQFDESGLTNLHFDQETIDDINYILSCFGKTPHAKKNDIPIVFTTLLGTTEFNYATQSFPAFIFEDVFQCSVDHNLDLVPKVGEKEQDYFLRLMEYRISNSSSFNHNVKKECLLRAKKIINKFCGGKNRIYFIKINDIMDYKCSFGDLPSFRNRKITSEEAQSEIAKLDTIKETIHNRSIAWLYNDSNFTDEYGVAIYGDFSKCDIKYIEVDRIYDVIQKIAVALGCKENEEIPETIMSGMTSFEQLNKLFDPMLKNIYYQLNNNFDFNITEAIDILSKPQISNYYDMFGRGRH